MSLDTEVVIEGAAMTRFGKHLDRSARDLVEEAVGRALEDAGLDASQVQAAYVGNAVAGLMSGQESIRAQVVLRRLGMAGIPMINTENACASSSTALHLAWQAVASGAQDCVLVVGFEKLYDADKRKSFRAFNASMDLDEMRERFGEAENPDRSVFMDLYASFDGASSGNGQAEREALAQVSVKNHHHGALNPFAQFRDELSPEQVLASRPVVGPLTVLMCAPLSDGAAALVLGSAAHRRRRTSPGVRIRASVLTSGRGDDPALETAATRAARRAYELSGIGPGEIDTLEVHDATAIAELHLYEELGLCAEHEALAFAAGGTAWLGGAQPVNPSGGLLAKGHPIGATGTAQVVELAWQLQGRCGARQVEGARTALAQNGGGWVGTDAAACCVHVLST